VISQRRLAAASNAKLAQIDKFPRAKTFTIEMRFSLLLSFLLDFSELSFLKNSEQVAENVGELARVRARVRECAPANQTNDACRNLRLMPCIARGTYCRFYSGIVRSFVIYRARPKAGFTAAAFSTSRRVLLSKAAAYRKSSYFIMLLVIIEGKHKENTPITRATTLFLLIPALNQRRQTMEVTIYVLLWSVIATYSLQWYIRCTIVKIQGNLYV